MNVTRQEGDGLVSARLRLAGDSQPETNPPTSCSKWRCMGGTRGVEGGVGLREGGGDDPRASSPAWRPAIALLLVLMGDGGGVLMVWERTEITDHTEF